MIDTISDPAETELFEEELLEADEVVGDTDEGTAFIIQYTATRSEEAFKQLVRLFHPRGANLLRRIGIHEEYIEDLMQETWLKVASKSGQFEHGRPFGKWFNRIALNTARDFLRRRKRHPPHLLASQIGEDGDDIVLDRAIEARHPCVDDLHRMAVHEVLYAMPRQYAEVIWQKHGLDTSTEELARRTDRAGVTIRWRIGQAHQKFQDLWGEEK